jgi:hypothetical protein
VVLHWRIAANRGLKIGDCFRENFSQDGLSKYQLTGLLDGKLIMGFAELNSYLRERHLSEEKLPLLIVPRPGRLAQVNQYVDCLARKNILVSMYKDFDSYILSLMDDLFLMANTVHLMITGVIAICAGFLFYLYFYQRRTEFGLLEALGHTRSMLIGRAFLEISLLNLLGFGSALGVSFLCGWALNHFVLHARGLILVLWGPGYLFELLLTPLFATFCSLMPVWRLLKQVDPVLLIERAGSCAAIKRVKPLSNWQYFRNNYRRVGPVFMVVFLSIVLEGSLLIYTISLLRLEERSEVEPWTKITYTGYLKNTPKKLSCLQWLLNKHPSVAKVLPYVCSKTKMSGVGVTTFPLIYLDANEIQPLMNVLNLKLVNGRLPTPDSYEIITHWQLAANWGIKIGDRMEKSKYRVVGLIDGKSLLGLGNLERYGADYPLSKENRNLLVIPKKGHLSKVKLYLTQLRQMDINYFGLRRTSES